MASSHTLQGHIIRSCSIWTQLASVASYIPELLGRVAPNAANVVDWVSEITSGTLKACQIIKIELGSSVNALSTSDRARLALVVCLVQEHCLVGCVTLGCDTVKAIEIKVRVDVTV